jgi:sugar phosphate permease
MMIHLMKIMPQGKTGIVMGLYSESENVGGIIISPIMGVIYDSMSPIFAVYIVSATLVADSALSALMTKKMNGSRHSPV